MIVTPDGLKAIETLWPGETVLSRNESDPEAIPRRALVTETQSLTGEIVELHLDPRVVRTTSEHPF